MNRRAVVRNVTLGAVATGLVPLTAAGAGAGPSGGSAAALCRSTFGEHGPTGGPVVGEGPSGDPMPVSLGWEPAAWSDGLRQVVTCVSVDGRGIPALTTVTDAPPNSGSLALNLMLPSGEPGSLVCEQSVLVGSGAAEGRTRPTSAVCFKLRAADPPPPTRSGGRTSDGPPAPGPGSMAGPGSNPGPGPAAGPGSHGPGPGSASGPGSHGPGPGSNGSGSGPVAGPGPNGPAHPGPNSPGGPPARTPNADIGPVGRRNPSGPPSHRPSGPNDPAGPPAPALTGQPGPGAAAPPARGARNRMGTPDPASTPPARAAFEAATSAASPKGRVATAVATPTAVPALAPTAGPGLRPAGPPMTALPHTGLDNHIPLAGAGGLLALGGLSILFGEPRRRTTRLRPGV